MISLPSFAVRYFPRFVAIVVSSVLCGGSLTAADALPKLRLGMNLAGYEDWNPGYPFRNLMYGARGWATQPEKWYQGAPFDTAQYAAFEFDDEGYPLEVPKTPEGGNPQILTTIVNRFVEPGEYVLLYDGEGDFDAKFGMKIVSKEPGRVVVSLGAGGVGGEHRTLSITRSEPGNHVRNMRLVAAADEDVDLAKHPFRDDFLKYASQFHVLRMIHPQGIVDSVESKWTQRRTPSSFTQLAVLGNIQRAQELAKQPNKRVGGMALELIIQLANTLKVDPWICVPHLADEEYIRNMAQMCKEKLDPGLTIYLEYSNELWNWGFKESQWMIRSKVAGDLLTEAGVTAWKNDITPEFEGEGIMEVAKGDPAPGTNHPERMGALFARCFKIWESVFTGDDRKRLVRVAATQNAFLAVGQRMAAYLSQHGGADAYAPAGYVGAENPDWTANGAVVTPGDIIEQMRSGFEVHVAKPAYANADIAREHGWRFITYEGGQHLQPPGQQDLPIKTVLGEAQKDPGMYNIYIDLFRLYQELGCDLFMPFNSFGQQGSRYGSWGHLEYLGQPVSEMPKMKAVVDVNIPRKKN